MVASDLHVLDDFYKGYGDIVDVDELRHKGNDFVKEFFPRWGALGHAIAS